MMRDQYRFASGTSQYIAASRSRQQTQTLAGRALYQLLACFGIGAPPTRQRKLSMHHHGNVRSEDAHDESEDERIKNAIRALEPLTAAAKITEAPKLTAGHAQGKNRGARPRGLSLKHRLDPQSLAEYEQLERQRLNDQNDLRVALSRCDAEKVYTRLTGTVVTEEMLHTLAESSMSAPQYLDAVISAYKSQTRGLPGLDDHGIPTPSNHDKIKDSVVNAALIMGADAAFVAALMTKLPGRVGKATLLESVRAKADTFEALVQSQTWYTFELDKVKRYFNGQGLFCDDPRVALVYSCGGAERRRSARSK